MVKIQVLGTFHRFILANQDKRKLVIYGGAGSGKSVAVAQWIVKQFHDGDNLRILCIRKTLPSLRITSYLLIKDILNQAGIIYEENKSELTLKHRSNTIFFKSIDDPEKVKSFEANLIWVEEATELSKEDYLQLDLRTRRAGSNQIILTFNPIDAFHWAITDLVQKPDPTVAVHHSTYKDNRFLPQAYIDTLESLIDQDYNYYRIYTLGEPGVLENTVYSHYKIEDASIWPDAAKLGTPSRLGIDFGFNDPTVIVSVKTHDNENYVKEILYKPKITNSDLISFLHSTFKANKWPYSMELVCDSAEPNRIEELCRAGFNAIPANKDIRFGIDQVKSRKLHLDAEAVNGIKEIRAYSYKKNKDGRVLDEPVDAFNHFCFVPGTLITTIDGDKPIESIVPGELVLTSSGYHPVMESGMTDPSAIVFSLQLSDGTTLSATPDHPIKTTSGIFKPLIEFKEGESVWKLIPELSTESNITDTRTPRIWPAEDISAPDEPPSSNLGADSTIRPFGSIITDQSPTDSTSTTRMETPSIMTLKISNASQEANISRCTWSKGDTTPNTWTASDRSPRRGTIRPKATNGTSSMESKDGTNARKGSSSARNADHSSEARRIIADSAPMLASPLIAEIPASITHPENVRFADSNSSLTGTLSENIAPVRAQLVTRIEETGRSPVYNLSVAGPHEYFANGVLVHNCDAMRYAIATGATEGKPNAGRLAKLVIR